MATNECSVSGCGRETTSRGWCAKHYRQWLRTGEPVARQYGPPKTIWDLLARTTRTATGCFEWQGARHGKGYGHVVFRGKTWKAHRVAYTLAVGEIMPGLVVAHRCDNPACVRPDHLWVGTQGDNIRDSVRKGRFRPAVRHPVKLDVRKARELRKLWSVSEKTAAVLRMLAVDYGVSVDTVRRVVAGRSWVSA